jgi:hypothetical protein
MVNATASVLLKPAEFVARNVTVLIPLVVGVPVTTPVVGFNVSPTGKVPEATA